MGILRDGAMESVLRVYVKEEIRCSLNLGFVMLWESARSRLEGS